MERDRGGRPRYPGVLTPAEQRVLDELREGGTNAEIAERLGLSRETVKTHIASMLSKLDLADRRELAAWRPELRRRGARGWLGLLVRPAVGLGAATGIVGVVVVFAVVIGGSRDDAVSIAVPALDIEGCSAVAETNPEANTEFVADCESLLGLRDTIRGTRHLDWTGSKPMSEWMGVIVSGTPQRVTEIDLSDLGLDGELSGLLGNLTGLTTLDLSGNPLTGMIPSKLELLSMTSVTLPDTFGGCAPPGFTAVSGLIACGAPMSTWTLQSGAPVPAGTYEFDGSGDEPTVVFDIPEDSGLTYTGVRDLFPPVEGESYGHSTTIMLFRNAEQTMQISIDLGWAGPGRVRFYDNFTSTGTASGLTRAEYEAIAKRIYESIWARAD